MHWCIIKLHLKKQDHTSFSAVSLHSVVIERYRIIFCLSDGNILYTIRTLRVHNTLVYQVSLAKNIHPSFSSVQQHSAVIGRSRNTFCLSDELAAYYSPLESSF